MKCESFDVCFWKALSIESQKLLNGHASTPTTPLPPEMSTFEDPTFKVGKLSVEERKEKIHRYLKKRNERNFSKKIKVIKICLNLLTYVFQRCPP